MILLIYRFANLPTGLNSLVKVGKSLSTLSNGVQPYVIQFPAYKGVHVFTEVSFAFRETFGH